MQTMKTVKLLTTALLALGCLSARAQYPRVADNIKAEAAAQKAVAEKLSDEAFARAMPVIKEWEAKGKPYLPGAGKPGDLPQAKIPAFPGAWAAACIRSADAADASSS